jgi:hypothetical protein
VPAHFDVNIGAPAAARPEGAGASLPARLGDSTGPEIIVDYLNGNDTTGTGSLANPYKTLTKAVTVADLAGGIVNLRNNGTPHQPASTERVTIGRNASSPLFNPCTIRTYPADGGRALFNGELMFGGTSIYAGQGWRLHGVEIAKLTAHRNAVGGYGFRIENSRHVELFDNVIRDTNQGNLVSGSVAGLPCDNVQIIGNLIHDAGSDDGSGGNTHDHGIYWGAETAAGVNNGAVYNNVIRGCHYGSCIQVYPRASGGIFVYNTLDNTEGMPDSDGGPLMFVWAQGTDGITDLVIDSNIMGRGRADALNECVRVNAAGNGSGNVLMRNLPYDIPSSSLWASWAGWSNNATRNTDNLSESTAASIYADADYHLLSGSPARGAGALAYLPEFDFDGVARTTLDLGAHTYVA